VKRRSILLALTGVVAVGTAAALYTPDLSRETLERQYLAKATDLRVVDGVRLHVRDTGPRTAPVLLLLHGFGASLHTWEPWARALEGEYRVVRLDLPGSGLSDPDPAGDYTDTRSVRLLTALLDTLGVARATLIGNSMGGRIAWTFAARVPARTDKLVLISPDGFASPGFEYDKAPEVPAALALMRYVLPGPLLRMNLEPAYVNPAAMTDSLAARYHDLMRAPGARTALLQRMRQTILTDPVPTLRTIQAPTLLLWGEADAMIPFANSADYLRAIPHATLVALPGVGHLPFEEAPERSLPPLRAFLQRQ